MINDQTLELHKFMQARRTLFCYSGPLSEDLLTQISNPVRQQLSESESDEGVAKRVFGVFVEQAQNIIRYANLRADTGEGVGTIAISVTEDDGFLIEAVNAIDSDKRTALESTLLELSMKDAKELRKMYKDRLRSGPPEGSKGAGLGLLKWLAECSALNSKSPTPRMARFCVSGLRVLTAFSSGSAESMPHGQSVGWRPTAMILEPIPRSSASALSRSLSPTMP